MCKISFFGQKFKKSQIISFWANQTKRINAKSQGKVMCSFRVITVNGFNLPVLKKIAKSMGISAISFKELLTH